MSRFAMPELKYVTGAVVIPLGSLEKPSDLNIVILITTPSTPETINWQTIENIQNDPSEMLKGRGPDNYPWVYQCCDYTSGLIFGLIEAASPKRFSMLKTPRDIKGVRAYSLA